MSTDSQDSLDQLLEKWSASRRVDEKHTDQLASQVLATVREQTDAGRSESAPFRHEPNATTLPERRKALVRPTEDWSGQLMIGGGGLLLFLILAGCLLFYNLTTVSPSNPQQRRPIADSTGTTPLKAAETNSLPPNASLGATVLAAKRKLLTETNDLFDNRLAWIADGLNEVSVEVGEQAAFDGGEFMLVRVVVAQRASPESPWSTVWQTDVISRNEALVEVPSKQPNGASLALWTYRMSDGSVAVDMDLMLDPTTRRQSSSSAVLRTGQPVRVSCSTENGIEQCVFQTVMPMSPSQI